VLDKLRRRPTCCWPSRTAASAPGAALTARWAAAGTRHEPRRDDLGSDELLADLRLVHESLRVRVRGREAAQRAALHAGGAVVPTGADKDRAGGDRVVGVKVGLFASTFDSSSGVGTPGGPWSRRVAGRHVEVAEGPRKA
jgi:hypothetical protein